MITKNHFLDRTAFTQHIGRVFAAFLLIGSLALTGCDSIDSNARDEDSQSPFAFSDKRAVDLIHWITPDDNPEVLNQEYNDDPTLKWPVSHIVGTWVLVSADIKMPFAESSHPLITFREDGVFMGYNECYNFSGRYQASSDWVLTVSDFRATNKFCFQEQDVVRDALFSVLQNASAFRFEHGTLWVMSQVKREQILIFERLEGDRSARDIDMSPVTDL